MFRALALRRSESRNCGLCVVYIQKYGATLLVGAWQREKQFLNVVNERACFTSCAWTFKSARARCKTCPFIYNVEKLSGPKRPFIRSQIILPVPQPMSSTV